METKQARPFLALPVSARTDGDLPRPSCVGRERELERLCQLWREVQAGGGRVALVSGEAGMGKSRLIDELKHRLAGAVRLEGACRDAAPPYQPIVEIVEQAVASLDVAEGAAERGREVLEALRGRQVPSGNDDGSWQLRRLALFEQVASFLADVARKQPLALFIHDVHCADASTRGLVAHLCETRIGAPELEGPRGPDERLSGLVVITSRDHDAAWLAGAAPERLPLGALDTDGVRAFLQSSEVVSFFAEATGGHPRALEALIEAQPAGADELLRSRWIRLGPEAQSLLSALAVFGRAAGLEALGAAAGIFGEPLASSVAEVLNARFVTKLVVAGELRLAFLRSADEQAISAMLADPIRRRLHASVGKLLSQSGASGLEDAVAVAEHLLRGQTGEDAVDAAVLAGERLEITFGYDRAIDLYRRAWTLTARDEVKALLETRLCELERLVGDYASALMNAGRLKARRPDAAAVRRVAQLHVLRDELDAGLRALDEAAALAGCDRAEAARVRAARAEAWFQKGESVRAKADCAEALSLGEDDLDPQERLAVQNTLGKVLLAEGSYLAAADTFAANVREARNAGRAFEECRALYNLGICQLRLGNSGEAQLRYQAALKVAEGAGDHRNRAFCLQNLGVLAHWKNDYSTALGYFHDAVSAFKKIGQRARLAWLALDLASVYLDLCALERAQAMLELAEKLASAEGTTPAAVAIDREMLAGRIFAQLGDLDRGEARFEEARRRSAAAEEHEREVEAVLHLARVSLQRGNVQDAVARVGALATPASQGTRARMLLLQGELEVARGEALSARRVLLESAELFHRLSDLEGEWRAHLVLGRAAAARNDQPEAERRYRAAKAIDDRVRERVPDEYREAHGNDPLRRELDRALGLPRVVPLPKGPRLVAEPVVKSRYPRMVGKSARLAQVFSLLDKLAPHDSLVLIRGESGTGKELIADALHESSQRRDRAFIKVNCGALVETLLLSELFGHERGAFTGALARKKGRFEAADGGTIFLDEIGDISPKTQVALLRVLQEREFERVGGTQPIKVDVRILCATNRNLEQMVARGEFREDLYYRLKGIQIELPSLRERPEDIPLLAESFLARVAEERGGEGARKHLHPDALDLLVSYAWPGNVRELENVIRSVSLFADGPIINVQDFSDYTEVFRRERPSPAPASPPHIETDGNSAWARLGAEKLSLKELKTRIEIECIREALEQTGGNITKAAVRLGMKRPRLSQLIKQYKIAVLGGENQ
jgi:DNA-binding NtrC family response regulator/tetratricopeptide (TPR) repeat protein